MNADQITTNAEGYLVDKDSGERVVFYTCDPKKNEECKKTHCRANIPENMGFCSSSTDPAHRAEGTRPFYKRLNSEEYFGREYIEEVAT